MKDFLYKNYNLKVSKIYKKNNNYYFFINDEKVYILKAKDKKQFNLLIDISNNLYKKGIKVNTFILNKYNSFYSENDDNYIVLMKENEKIELSLSEINKFSNIKNDLKNYDIISEWSKEIDDLEEELKEHDSLLFIKYNIDFYIGISENAIQLLSEYYDDRLNDFICHILPYNNYQEYFLNNPFTFIKTNKMYNVSNYIKMKIYKNEINEDFYNNISKIIKSNSPYQNVFLISCLLYASDYFSILKRILVEEEKEEFILKYIDNIENYINVIIFCKKIIKNVKKLENFTWF